MKRTLWSMLAATLVAGFSVTNAHATVLINDNQPIAGSSAAIQVPLTVDGPGVLSVTLTDFGSSGMPEPFSSLQFGLSDSSTSLTSMSSTGTLHLDLTAPETVYANVFATTQGGFGLYNLTADFEPASAVPLPGTLILLAAGLLTLFIYRARYGESIAEISRRGERATVTSAMA